LAQCLAGHGRSTRGSRHCTDVLANIVALARGHNDKAAKIAEERLGMTSQRLHRAHEVAKYMPQGTQDAGTAMHRTASRFAIESENAGVTGDLKPVLGYRLK
jgi:hypothetical protein